MSRELVYGGLFEFYDPLIVLLHADSVDRPCALKALINDCLASLSILHCIAQFRAITPPILFCGRLSLLLANTDADAEPETDMCRLLIIITRPSYGCLQTQELMLQADVLKSCVLCIPTLSADSTHGPASQEQSSRPKTRL